MKVKDIEDLDEKCLLNIVNKEIENVGYVM